MLELIDDGWSVWVAGSSTAPNSLKLRRSGEWRRICGRCWRQSSQIPRSGSLGLPLLPAAERRRVVVDWNETQTSLSAASALFPNGSPGRSSARRTPWRCPPGEFGSVTRELASRASPSPDRLCREGVGPDEVVVLLAERGIDFLAAMIAVQQAGGAFLPLDPTIPAARLAQIDPAQRRTARAGHVRAVRRPAKRRCPDCRPESALAHDSASLMRH